jgi:thioesterase domain-containing protein
MTQLELQKFIHEKIPLSKAMGLQVAQASMEEGVSFNLPLAPNRNHKNTAFGGTLVATQAICCWAWVTLFLLKNSVEAEVVLQRQTAEFHLPVEGDFSVHVNPPSSEEAHMFLQTLKKHDKARIALKAQVTHKQNIVCEYKGDYVAIKAF